MDGIVISELQIPAEVRSHYRLRYRLTEGRDGTRRYTFLTGARTRELPVWLDGRFRIVPWGCTEVRSILPRTCWTWSDAIVRGYWHGIQNVEVVVPCSRVILDGVWSEVEDGGVRGLVGYDLDGMPHAYLVLDEPGREGSPRRLMAPHPTGRAV